VGLGQVSVRLFRKPADALSDYGVWAWIAILTGSAAGTSIAAQRVSGVGGPGAAAIPRPAADLQEWFLIGLALVIAGCLTVEVRHQGEIESFDVFEVALAPALYFLTGPQAVLLAAAAKALSQLLLRTSMIKLAFNVAQWAACAGCGGLTFAVVARTAEPRLALPAAMVVVAVTNLAALVGLFAVLDGFPAVYGLLHATAM
jgi:hypothetical protein